MVIYFFLNATRFRHVSATEMNYLVSVSFPLNNFTVLSCFRQVSVDVFLLLLINHKRPTQTMNRIKQ